MLQRFTLLFCIFFVDLQLDVKGCRDVYASFDKYVEVERLEGDNKYHAEEHGLQVSLCVWYNKLHLSFKLPQNRCSSEHKVGCPMHRSLIGGTVNAQSFKCSSPKHGILSWILFGLQSHSSQNLDFIKLFKRYEESLCYIILFFNQ